MRSTDLTNATLTRVIARKANFHDATLRGANLSYGRFEQATFKDAEMELAVLNSGNFDGADFKDASLRHAQLGGADLSRARGLTQDQLDEACGDSRTRLPSGLSVRSGCAGMHINIRIPRVIVTTPAPPAPPAPPRYLVEPEPRA